MIPLGTVLNGSSPSSAAPWLTARFTTLFPGEVQLTLESHLDVPSEFIEEVAFNINPAFVPADLIFSRAPGMVDYQIHQPQTQNSITLSGGGSTGKGFDISIDFSNGPGLPRFDGFQTQAFTIDGPATLSANDFLFYNSINNQDGPAIIGAHIQGIPASGGGTTSSAIIQTVPEPGSGLLVILALMLRYRGKPPAKTSP